MQYNAKDILIAREKRVEFQKKLIDEYKNTLIMIRVNYPGVNKNNYVTKGIMNSIYEDVLEIFIGDICYKRLRETAEGPIANIVVSIEPENVKKVTINIEHNNVFGRFVDIDVYDLEGKALSRTELGYSMRKCYLCQGLAHECVREKKHKLEEVTNYIEDNYNLLISNKKS